MTYFSLFYENREQEYSAKKQSENQVYYRAKQKLEKKTYFVGARMVVSEEVAEAGRNLPCFFQDLNLEAVFLPDKDEHLTEELKNYYFSFPETLSEITYRQEIYKDLDNLLVLQGLTAFRNDFTEAERLLEYRHNSDSQLQKSKYYIDAALLHYESARRLYDVLKEQVKSRAFLSLLSHLTAFLNRDGYNDFYMEATRLKEKLESIHFTLTMAGNTVKVYFHENTGVTEDFGSNLEKVFRIQEHSRNSIRLFNQPGLNPFESKLISLVEKEYPKLRKECLEFTASDRPLTNDILQRLYKESEVYLSGHMLASKLREKGFLLAYPEFTETRSLHLEGICDIGLALATGKHREVAVNDLLLAESNKGAFITGVNQGGKTTYARSVGQTAYLAMLGMPVIATKALLPHFNGIHTHFTVEENHLVNNGKLQEELHHLKEILDKAPTNCLYLLNEMFSSTTAADAFDLTSLLLPKIFAKAGTVLCVTHVPELAKLQADMISLIASAREEDGYERTYRIRPGEAALSARAIDIALKYCLSGTQIKERIANGD